MREPVPLIDETYYVMVIVLLAILLGACCFDITVKNRTPRLTLFGTKSITTIPVILGLLGFILALLTSGNDLLLSNKHDVMEATNRWHIIWITGASIGALLSFVHAKWKLFLICFALLLFDLYIGFRYTIAITTISIFVLWLSEKGNQRLVFDNWKICITGLICSMFFFVYKFIYTAIKLGDWSFVFHSLKNPQFYVTTITHSEPFTTQLILNEVLKEDFNVGMGNLSGIIYQFILFAPELGAETIKFAYMFQPKLFPSVDFGMASNVWAHIWSSGGWLFLIAFIVFYVFILFVGSYLLRLPNETLKSGVALFFSYWAFYIHRNDISYQINLEKRVFLFFALCLLISILLSYLHPRQVRGK